jgi:nucleotide-binding universal stress UspA family protein
MKFTRILCAVDFSQPSIAAFETAAELARALRAELHVVHSIEAEPRSPDITLHQKAVAAMDALIASDVETDPNLRIRTEVTTGNAASEILNYARDRKIELIVLGANGLTLPEEAVLGGTAKLVMNEAACSVLVVRHE